MVVPEISYDFVWSPHLEIVVAARAYLGLICTSSGSSLHHFCTKTVIKPTPAKRSPIRGETSLCGVDIWQDQHPPSTQRVLILVVVSKISSHWVLHLDPGLRLRPDTGLPVTGYEL